MTIIIVEGPDGAGKSTLIERAAAKFDWPSDYVMALPRDDMKAYWRRHPEEATAENMLRHVSAEMEKHMAKNPVAIFDRGWPSTFVYQGGLRFEDLPEFLQKTETIVYTVLPPLSDLLSRKAKRDGVDVGSGLADHQSTAEIHKRYANLAEIPKIRIVFDDGPDLDKFMSICAYVFSTQK